MKNFEVLSVKEQSAVKGGRTYMERSGDYYRNVTVDANGNKTYGPWQYDEISANEL